MRILSFLCVAEAVLALVAIFCLQLFLLSEEPVFRQEYSSTPAHGWAAVRNKILNVRLQEVPTRVVLFGMFGASWLKNGIELANYLAAQPDFDVTFVGPAELEAELRSGVKMYKLPMKKSEMFPPFNKSVVVEMFHIQKKYTSLFMKEDPSLISFLRSQKFDAAVTFNQDYEAFLTQAAGIPTVREAAQLPNQMYQLLSGAPCQTAWDYPLIKVDLSDFRNFKNRLAKTLISTLLAGMQSAYYQDSFFDARYLHAKEEAKRVLLVGHGVYGFRDSLQLPPNAQIFQPFLPTHSRFEIKPFDDGDSEALEYLPFLQRHDHNVLIAFGTTFMPEQALLETLIEAIRQLPNTGFVVSLKNMDPGKTQAYSLFSEAFKGTSNVLLKKSVPQKRLLNSEKIGVFITHAGANSAAEGIYFSKQMIVFPQNLDQQGNAYRIDQLKLGVIFPKKLQPTATDITRAIRKAQTASKSTENRLSRLQEYIEKRSGINYARTIEFAAKFGVAHLSPPAHTSMGYLAAYDFDIKLLVLALAFAFLLVLRKVARQWMKVLM